MTTPNQDPFLDEVQALKKEAAERTPTLEELARRLRELEDRHEGPIVQPPKDSQTDAA